MKIKTFIAGFALLFTEVVFCSENVSTFVGGADVSWLTQMEASGKKFYNAAGTQTECMTLLKSLGVNSIRLRVWVNPATNWCNTADVLAKAIRANNLGMRIMIDFHYSDTWADPSHQTKPAAWTSLSLADLKNAVATHTTDVLTQLKNNNITPEWVQVGNENNNGMLWETGKASVSMANYAALTTAGYDAVKAVFPNCKVIVHLSNGWDNSLFRWIFDGLKNNGGKWDVVGLSVYPTYYTTANDWQNCNTACLTNMNDMVSRYGKEVMVVECGMSWDSPTVCNSFLTDLISKTKSVTGGKGLGMFYWEPECYGSWSGYTLGAFDNSGKPTAAMDAFKVLLNDLRTSEYPEISVRWNKEKQTIDFSTEVSNVNLYNLKGQLIPALLNSRSVITGKLATGVYLVKGVMLNSGKSFGLKVSVE